MRSFTSYLVAVTSTLTSAGVIAGVGVLRGLSRRFRVYEEKQFRDALHLLDHETRLEALEPGRSR